MNAADPKFKEMDQAEKFLVYLHENQVIELSYLETHDGRINLIRKKINGN